MPLTANQLAEIRRRDSNVEVFRDQFGGEFVMSRDGRIHGQYAIMDRRHLLEHIDELNRRLHTRAPC